MTKNYLKNLKREFLGIIKMIGIEADKRNQRAYIVGGIVRDVFLRRDTGDIDIVTEKNAIVLAKSFARRKKAKIVSHTRFGTATVKIHSNMWVDFALTRKEKYSSPGALPVVSPGTLKEDLVRRDFTINTLALNINRDHFGHLIDVFSGKEDIKKGRVRVLHDKSFIDDPTRILRAVRFEQRFNFKIEPKTLRLLKNALKKNAPSSVKSERYFAEFKKILCEDAPEKSLVRLNKLGVLKFLGCRSRLNTRLLKDVAKGIKALKKKKYGQLDEWWVIYFMVLMSGESLSGTERILCKFNLKKNDRKKILQLQEVDVNVRKLSKKNLSASEVFQILDSLDSQSILFLWLKTKKSIIRRRIDKFFLKSRYVQLSINGNDIKNMGNLTGQQVGKVLRVLLYKEIDGLLKNKRDELKAAKKLLG